MGKALPDGRRPLPGAVRQNLITTALLDNFVGTGLASQPDESAIEGELDSLMNNLASCGSNCPADRTETVVKASCAAVLGSAVTLVQ